MNMLYVLIPLALLLLGAAVWALVWAIQSGQFDDLESQGWSVVLDEDKAVAGKETGELPEVQNSTDDPKKTRDMERPE